MIVSIIGPITGCHLGTKNGYISIYVEVIGDVILSKISFGKSSGKLLYHA